VIELLVRAGGKSKYVLYLAVNRLNDEVEERREEREEKRVVRADIMAGG